MRRIIPRSTTDSISGNEGLLRLYMQRSVQLRDSYLHASRWYRRRNRIVSYAATMLTGVLTATATAAGLGVDICDCGQNNDKSESSLHYWTSLVMVGLGAAATILNQAGTRLNYVDTAIRTAEAAAQYATVASDIEMFLANDEKPTADEMRAFVDKNHDILDIYVGTCVDIHPYFLLDM